MNMDSSPITRIIDANLNRLAEGLRVLEDIARMLLNDSDLTRQLKTLRHALIRSDLNFNLELLQSRNAAGDVGAAVDVAGENKEKELPLIIIANSRRAQESLRALEETAKLPEMASRLDSDQFKQARFELYTIERELVSRILREDKAKKVSGLYVIIDTEVLHGRSHIEAARGVIEAGVKVIQFRGKTMEKKLLLPVALELQTLCRKNEVLFIINDYLDIALAADADGLHVGQGDLPAAVARRLLPLDKILGCSVNSVQQAVAAEAAGADYIAVGCIYPTSSKEDVELVGVGMVRQVRQAVKAPLVAIGGINRNNVREVTGAGADAVCVISAVLSAPDIGRAARDMIEVIIEAKK
jgi:thiamine-phosphate pyrophosphorylase